MTTEIKRLRYQSFTHLNYYCLRCFNPNNCKCEDKSFCFDYSHKLRVPTSTKNKVVFRKFLDDCPQFVNCVPEELHEEFRSLLKRVKYTNTPINGQQWTKC